MFQPVLSASIITAPITHIVTTNQMELVVFIHNWPHDGSVHMRRFDTCCFFCFVVVVDSKGRVCVCNCVCVCVCVCVIVWDVCVCDVCVIVCVMCVCDVCVCDCV